MKFLFPFFHRVRTLTGKEIELDIEADYKVHIQTPDPLNFLSDNAVDREPPFSDK